MTISIILGLIFILVILVMIVSIKKNTNFSLLKSIILGLTISPFMVFSLAADLLNKLSALGLKLGAQLGGENMDSIMKSFLTKQIESGNMKVRGDESENKPEEDDLH
jgi:hypothetical protein